MNGRRYAGVTNKAVEAMTELTVGVDGAHVVTGGSDGVVSVCRMHDLKTMYRLEVDAAVTALETVPEGTAVMVGTQDGRLLVLTSAALAGRM